MVIDELEEDTWKINHFSLDDFVWDAKKKTLTYKRVVRHGSLPNNFDVQGKKHLVGFGEIEDDPKNQRCLYPVDTIDGHFMYDHPLKGIVAIMNWKKKP
jgi:hypothetical protein